LLCTLDSIKCNFAFKSKEVLVFFGFFFYSFINMCIHCLGNFSTLSPAHTLSHPPPLTSRQNLFCPYL
jgi:hypothetical protein